MNKIIRLVVFAALVAGATGCSIGKHSVLFATKTSYAVDIDAKPPTVDIGYGRTEGTLSPVYANGAILPQMASFHTDTGWFKTGIGQSFAVGKSAVLLARYFSSPSDLEPHPIITDDDVRSATPASLPSGKRKAYFFGTQSSFGVKIHFDAETGGLPSSLSVGYKRKELAYVPISTIVHNGTTNDTVPSLLATAGLGVDARSATNTGVSYNQFFATGLAADYLAAQRVVRETIGTRIINDRDLQRTIRTRRDEGLKAADEASAIIDTLKGEELNNAGHIARALNLFNDDNLKKFLTLSEAEKRTLLKHALVGEGTEQWSRVKFFVQVLKISQL